MGLFCTVPQGRNKTGLPWTRAAFQIWWGPTKCLDQGLQWPLRMLAQSNTPCCVKDIRGTKTDMGVGFFKNFVRDAQSRLQNFDHLYTSKSKIFLPITIRNCRKNTQFGTNWVLFGLIFWNTPNFANWAHWVLNGNPPIDIPIMMKKHT